MEDEITIIEDESSDEDYIENEDCLIKLEDDETEDPLDFNSNQFSNVCLNQEYTNSIQSQSDSNKTKPLEKRTPLLCHICGKKFARITMLNDHMAFHNDSEVFKCDECSKTFGTKQHLTQHMSSHKLDRRYKCSFCHKQFKNSTTLNGHEKIHTKPYKCEVCGAGFSRRDRREKHLIVHHGPQMKPSLFICECGKSFKKLVALHSHQFYHHVKCPTILPKS